MKTVPKEFLSTIGYGLYGGVVQYYIKGVDGTLAQLGNELPSAKRLTSIIENARRDHEKLIQIHKSL